MNFIGRTFLLIIGVTVMAVGVWLALASTHVIDGYVTAIPGLNLLIDPASERVPFRLAWLGAAVATLGIGAVVSVVAMSTSSGDSRHDRIVLKASDPNLYGDTRVTITRAGLHSIAARVAQDVPGVRQARTQIGLSKRGWAIRCGVATWDKAVLPEIARQVSDDVRRLVEHHTGIPVDRVDVDIQYEPFTAPSKARVV